MIYTNIDNFYLSKEELENSPSRQDNIDYAAETTLRIYGCELIQEAGILLKCPQAVMATGQVMFHRFYCKQSMRHYHVKRVAAACCWLATKLEETPRRTREVILVFDRIIKRREGRKLTLIEPASKEYEDFKASMIRNERNILKTFGFIVHVEHPHKFVLSYVHVLEGKEDLMQEAWNILNDSLRTTLCVRFNAEIVACGAIFLAARRLQIPLPEDPPWWEVFSPNIDQLVEVVQTLYDLYNQPKAQYIHVHKDPQPASQHNTPQVPDGSMSPEKAETGGLPGAQEPAQGEAPETTGEGPAVAPSETQASVGTDRELNGHHLTADTANAGGSEKRKHRDRDRSRRGESPDVRPPDRDRERERDRSRRGEVYEERDRERARSRREDPYDERQAEPERKRDRDRDLDRDYDRERVRHKERHHRSRDHGHERIREKDRHRDREKDKEKEREKAEREKEREKAREKQEREASREARRSAKHHERSERSERDSSREKIRDSSREKTRMKEHLDERHESGASLPSLPPLPEEVELAAVTLEDEQKLDAEHRKDEGSKQGVDCDLPPHLKEEPREAPQSRSPSPRKRRKSQ